jgi:hypothetical protein
MAAADEVKGVGVGALHATPSSAKESRRMYFMGASITQNQFTFIIERAKMRLTS